MQKKRLTLAPNGRLIVSLSAWIALGLSSLFGTHVHASCPEVFELNSPTTRALQGGLAYFAIVVPGADLRAILESPTVQLDPEKRSAQGRKGAALYVVTESDRGRGLLALKGMGENVRARPLHRLRAVMWLRDSKVILLISPRILNYFPETIFRHAPQGLSDSVRMDFVESAFREINSGPGRKYLDVLRLNQSFPLELVTGVIIPPEFRQEVLGSLFDSRLESNKKAPPNKSFAISLKDLIQTTDTLP